LKRVIPFKEKYLLGVGIKELYIIDRAELEPKSKIVFEEPVQVIDDLHYPDWLYI